MRVLALAFVVLLLPLAAAQGDDTTLLSGEPAGVQVLVNGVDIDSASRPAQAIVVDIAQPLHVTFRIVAPDDASLEVRAVRVGVLVNGPGSEPVEKMQQEQRSDITLPPGRGVSINRTVDLADMTRVGSGLFLLRVDVVGGNETILHQREFYAKIEGGAGLLTVQGATMTAMTLATGYGFLTILNDLREAYQARERHRKKQRARGKLAKAVEATVGVVTGEVEGAVDAAGGMSQRAERYERRRPIAWSLTGLGLGAVALSWLQFFGYAPFDATAILITALTVGAAGLTLALLTTALLKRARARRAEAEATRRVPVEEPSPARAATKAVDKKP